MVDDIIRVSENVVKVYVKRYPQQVNFDIYRGDSWSFTIIGLNVDDTPFDWSICEKFAMNFRIGHSLNPEVAVTLDSDTNFVLGKTQLEQPEYDELHLVDTEGVSFQGLSVPEFYYDLQFLIGIDPYTAIKGAAHLEYDTTRG